VDFQIRDTGDLRAVTRELRRHKNGREVRRQLVREFQAIQRPMVARVRASWRSAPGARRRYRGGPPLRTLLVKATRGQVRMTGQEAGIRIRTDGRRMPAGMKSLPRMVEGTRRWRHPVFDEDTWVTQQPFPRFFAAVQPDADKARRQAERAGATILQQIARAR
jgi:hypothetical protein